jgi:predicted NUDIX family phosphoesterase
MFFIERDYAEHDPTFKQIIPYTLVAKTKRQVLRMTRKKGGGEARLHGFHSIGAGGHINPGDQSEQQTPFDIIHYGIQRELREELSLAAPYVGGEPVLLGTLNDESNAVGQVHFGLVHLVVVEPGNVAVAEPETLSAEWLSMEALWSECRAKPETYEVWSRMILEAEGVQGDIAFVLQNL